MLESTKEKESRLFWENELKEEISNGEIFVTKNTYNTKDIKKINIPITQEEYECIQSVFKQDYLQFVFFFTTFQICQTKLISAEKTMTHMMAIGKGKNLIFPIVSTIKQENMIKEVLVNVDKKVKFAIRYNEIQLNQYMNNVNYLLSDSRISNIGDSLQQMKEYNSKLLINLNCQEKQLELFYRLDVINEVDLKNFFHVYEYVRKQCIENLCIQVKDIMLIQREKNNVFLFSDIEIEYQNEHIINMFRQVAQRQKDAVAVVCGNQKVTYDELELMSNTVASNLSNIDLGNRRIAVYMKRSVYLIATLLGVLKAGCAYIPIDAEVPQIRVLNILNDSQANVIISDCAMNDSIDQVQILNPEELITNNPEAIYQLESSYDSKQEIYIIYTSGTTGQPKGIIVRNHNLINYINWRNKQYSYSDKDIVLQLISVGFDGFAANLYSSLLSGGQLIMTDEESRKNYSKIAKLVQYNHITKMSLVPSMYRLLLYSSEQEQLESVNQVVLAAESATESLISESKSKNPAVQLINEYGPSECTVGVTANMNLDENNLDIIGYPIENTKAFILNQNLEMLPIGFIGELCFCGAGVTEGYIDREEETQKKYIKDFYHGHTLYRTGDLARWTDNGKIQIFGRIDSQVKVNGQRIEIQEIENAMSKLDGIKEAIIYVQNKIDICAYIVSENNVQLSIDNIAQELKQVLPNYMIPKFYVFLTSIPVTINGKVDYKALPMPRKDDCKTQEIVEPTDQKEEAILIQMKKVLGINKIGIHHNFFDIGGNSIKAIELCTNLNYEFNINPQDIYEGETAENIAKKISYKKEDTIKQILKKNEKSELIDNEIKKYSIKKDKNELMEKYASYNFNKKNHYSNVLLLGATGYLGCHILNKLLLKTNYKIILIIREKDGQLAYQRLQNIYQYYFDNCLSEYTDRIKIFSGDITQELFGVSLDCYHELIETVDVVINSAANVKHFGKYEDFYDINVESNRRLIQFIREGKKKDYNYISTLSVAGRYIEGKDTFFYDETKCDVGQKIDSYYVNTKLDAEREIINQREKGDVNINIFRVGNLTFDSTTGIFQKNIDENAFYALFKAMYLVDKIPMLESKIWDFSYADQTAEAIVILFDKAELKNRTYHIRNNVVSPYECYNLLFSGSKEVLDMDSYILYLLQAKEQGRYIDLIDMLIIHGNVDKIGKETVMYIDTTETDVILELLGFRWKQVNRQLLNLMVAYCKKQKFLLVSNEQERKVQDK